MIIAVILIFSIYLFIFFYLKTLKIKQTFSSKCKISVIISAKNESENIDKIFNALITQNYPKDKYEIIFIDDNSTDNTFELLTNLSNQSENIKILKAKNKIYEGKRGALQIGIDSAIFENIVVTDADCVPNPEFLSSYSDQFQSGVKFVFGVAPYIQTGKLINKIACFDNFWVHLLTFSFANIGLPYSAAARSLGFTKELFNDIGGYSNTTDTLSGDDDLLLREVVKKKYKIGLILNEKANVYSKTKDTFKDLIQQKSRHTSTSNYYSSRVKLILGLWHLLNYFMLFSIFFLPLNISYTYLFVIKLSVDIIIIKSFMKTFHYNFSVFEIIYLQIFYEFLLLLYYFKGIFNKSKW
ncbi:MAG: glycosyltransferase [Melioribacteraceae bacterium]|nr:glycosyltransferase [Melioribacteraceae bacterium]